MFACLLYLLAIVALNIILSDAIEGEHCVHGLKSIPLPIGIAQVYFGYPGEAVSHIVFTQFE